LSGLPSTVDRERLASALQGLDAWGTARGWRGTDPYDGLNATRLAGPLRSSPFGRRVLTQTVKRSPVDLRPLLGIEPGLSAAALANVISAYSLHPAPTTDQTAKLKRTIERLLAERSPGYDLPCWGYHFDVQTRVFFYPAGSPNTIATAFAGQALLDSYERLRAPELLALAGDVGEYFLQYVPQTPTESGAYFGYLTGDRTPIHNANMLVCALLARLADATGREDCRKTAEAGVAYTVARQRSDGSWPYGEEPHLDWVDNFHTGYVLEALLTCWELGIGGEPAAEALEHGLRYYRQALFIDDGTPLYGPGKMYPTDAQCVAQGIETFARAGVVEPAWTEFAWTIFRVAIQEMRRRDGSFIFQRRRYWRNTTPHIRWVAAPMLLALVQLLRTVETDT
jgi:hypothetical protein